MRYRHRRCSHSHCSGCSRTQDSTTAVIACMVPRDIDAAFGVAHRWDFRADLAGEAIAGQPDHPGAVDRAFDLAGEHGDQRVRQAFAAEESDLDAAAVMLVDQHGDVAALLQRAGERHRRAHARGDRGRP